MKELIKALEAYTGPENWVLDIQLDYEFSEALSAEQERKLREFFKLESIPEPAPNPTQVIEPEPAKQAPKRRGKRSKFVSFGVGDVVLFNQPSDAKKDWFKDFLVSVHQDWGNDPKKPDPNKEGMIKEIHRHTSGAVFVTLAQYGTDYRVSIPRSLIKAVK